MAPDDTIVAVSTPAGASPAAIVRLSGPEALAIVGALLAEPAIDLAAFPGYTALDTCLRLRPDGPPVPATVYVMRAPRSYTREDVAEMHTIGSVPLVRMLLDAATARGARVAEPGEFTRRAYLNGRIDLAQAEAVLGIIQARGEAELRAAARALAGRPARHVHELHDTLVGLRAQVEASIDFAMHDIELITEGELLAAIDDTLAGLNGELRCADAGALPPEGIRVALCGLPNAGKSSLFNALLAGDHALVADLPGTTRDAVAEPLTVGGIRFRLYDTAGLFLTGNGGGTSLEENGSPRTPLQRPSHWPRDSSLLAASEASGSGEGPGVPADSNPEAHCRSLRGGGGLGEEATSSGKGFLPQHPFSGDADDIDAEAAVRAWGLIAGTHIAVAVLDGSRPVGDAERALWAAIDAPRKLLVLHKADLRQAVSDQEAAALAGDALVVRTSALTEEGIGELRAALVAAVRTGQVDASPADVVWNARHRQSLRRARAALERARAAVAEGLGDEFVAADLRDAHTALAAITGHVVAEDILDLIFAEFCIGK